MGKQEILPKRLDYLEANTPSCRFRINVDVINECFGANSSLYMRAAYPSDNYNNFRELNSNIRLFAWLPKLFSNSSEWKNTISADEEFIYEDAEDSRTQDWIPTGKHPLDHYRLVFAKATSKDDYVFKGIYKSEKMENLHHVYKRVATKAKLIGNPVHTIEIIYDSSIRAITVNDVDEKPFDYSDESSYIQAVNDYSNKNVVIKEYVPVPEEVKKPEVVNKIKKFPRNPAIAVAAIQRSNYLCEYNSSHESFTSCSTGERYTEAHHLIPISYQDMFPNSLDVQANIVSLCSNCHNCIHYGREKGILLTALYNDRKKELEKAGIFITLDGLMKMYGQQ